jgi:hypothetical protein
LIIYGREKATKLRETLLELYEEFSFPLKNEFQSEEPIRGKHWSFKNYSQKDFLFHQRIKLIYALFDHEKMEES